MYSFSSIDVKEVKIKIGKESSLDHIADPMNNFRLSPISFVPKRWRVAFDTPFYVNYTDGYDAQ